MWQKEGAANRARERRFSRVVSSSGAPDPAVNRANMTQPRSAWRLFAVIAVGCVPAVVGWGAVQNAAALFSLANSQHPYFVPAHAGILYVWTPLVVISTCLLFLAPGLFLSLALDAAAGVGQWMLTGFALSLVTISAAAGVVQSITGRTLRGGAFVAVVLACLLVSFAFLLIRLARGRPLAWPLGQAHAGTTLLSMAIVPALLLIALAPKFYWESFNGDGAEAYEVARLLLVQPLPFWPPEAGEISSFPGVTTMLFAYPGSWFIRLFGEVEASARLPLLLYLIPLYGAMVALIDQGRPKPIRLPERLLVWLGLVVYVVAIAFSATYNPYSADIAAPAAQYTLLMACFLGFVLALLRQAWGWMWFLGGLAFLAGPNGLLLIGLWSLAMILVWRPRPWRQVGLVGVGLLGCLVVAVALPSILALARLPIPGGEHGAIDLLARLAFLQWADWRRIAFMVVPCGILPAVALFAWRWQDQVARTLTIVTVLYFGLFFFVAHIVLHHFVPVMLLPLAVFWRSDWVTASRYRPLVLGSTAVAGVVALLISLPRNAAPYTTARLVGATIEDRLGGYEAMDPAAFRRSELLGYLFPYAWDPRVPSASYGAPPLAWCYYENQEKGDGQEVNYILQSASDPGPAGTHLLVQQGDVALYVRSEAVWASHCALRPPTPAGSPVYAIPRGIIFRSVPLEDGPPIVNVVDLVENAGIDMEPILDRLGVKR
jgi:hypothetical protein